ELAVDEDDSQTDDSQTDITDETASAENAAAPVKKRTRGGRAALPPELPRVEVVHELDDAERCCAEDGTELKVIGEVVSEELHV
ncbi:IS66 family transposase, partial [Halomonas sp. ATCHA]|nr:IS66 family transposase [Halomonas llamarensis]